MATIDKKIVQIQMDNKDFESNAKTSLSTMDKIKKNMDFSSIAKGLDGLGKASNIDMSSLHNNVDTIASRFSALGIIGVTALMNITNSAIDAGAALVKSITVAPISQGFGEYELKMGSIQTIMSGTGRSLEDVNKALSDLNLYADKTIYSFSDMTSNIGKFTNAGISLEDSVAAIQGISNVAALSGANANEASRAMYNFAQALSAGHVKLIDWKSIGDANMATTGFKNQLMDAAVAAGTLEKRADGMYQVLSKNGSGKTMKGVINATSQFNESLEYQWMTTEVLVGTLAQYSDETTEIGKAAYQAATNIKTFTDFMGNLQEGVGSGWSDTFELIIGDFEESKAFWTKLANIFGESLHNQAEARNSMLLAWKKMGGRDAMMDGIFNTLEGIGKIIDPIKRAFRDLFPAKTGEDLFKISEAFKSFSLKIIDFATVMDGPIYYTFKGFFSIVKASTNVAKLLVDVFFGVLGVLTPLLKGILMFTGGIGEFISFGAQAIDVAEILRYSFRYLEQAISMVAQGMEMVFAKLGTTITGWTKHIKMDTKDLARQFDENTKDMTWSMVPVAKAFSDVRAALSDTYQRMKPVLKAIAKAVVDTFNAIKRVLAQLFKDFNALDFQNVLNVGVITLLAMQIKKFFEILSGPAKGLGDIMEAITGILDAVRKSFEAWQANLKAKTLLKIASAIALLAGSLWLLSTIETERLLYALGAISTLFAALFISLLAFQKILKSGGLTGMAQVATGMILLSVSVLILSLAVKQMGMMDWDVMQRGLTALAVAITALVLASKYMAKDSKDMIAVSGALIVFGLAIAAIVKSVRMLGDMRWQDLVQGLGALTIIIGELILVSKKLVGDKDMVVAAANLKSLGAAILIIALAVKLLGGMKWQELALGLGSVTAIIAALTVASRSLPSDMAARAAGMMVLASAIVALSIAVQILGRMPITKLAKGIGALAAVLHILVVAVNAISKDVVGLGGILALAVAVNLLVIPLILLGSMPFDVIAQGLVALAGIFYIFSASALALTPVAPTLLTVAGSFALFGLAIAGIGAGVLALSVGLVALGASAGVIGVGIVALMGGLVLGLTVFMQGLGGIVAAFIDSLGTIVIGMSGTFLKLVTNILPMIIDATPAILGGILTLLSTIFSTLVEHMPRFMETGAQLIMGFLDGLASNISGIISSARNLITTFINSLIEQIPAIMEVGVNFLTAIMEGITLGLPALVEGAVDLIVTFVRTLTEQIPLLVTTAVDFIVAMAQTLIDNLPRLVETAVQIVVTFVTALGEQIPVIIDAAFKLIIDFINGLADAIRDNTGDLLAAGANLVAALVEGIVDGAFKMLGIVWESAKSIVGKVVGAIKDGFTWLKDNGWDIMKNVVNGILGAAGNLATSVWNGAKDIVGKVTGAIKDSLSGLWDSGWDIAKNVVDGILGGIGNLGKKVWNAAKDLGSKLLGGLNNFLGINSPSKETYQVALWTGEGVVNGIVAMGKKVYDAGKGMGKKILDPIAAALTKVVDDIEDNPDYNPIITPVLDTSGIDGDLKDMNTSLSKMNTVFGAANLKASAIKVGRVVEGPKSRNDQNGSTQGQDNSVTTNNITLGGTYHIREESDIHKVAKELHNLTKKKARA